MIGIENFSVITPADSAYPHGSLKNRSGADAGTPLNFTTLNDIYLFFDNLLYSASLTPNDLHDNETNGYQSMEALTYFNAAGTVALIRSLIGSVYSSSQLYIIYGLTGPGDNGVVLYDNMLYYVVAPSPMPGTPYLTINTPIAYTAGLRTMSIGSSGSILLSSGKRYGNTVISASSLSAGWTGIPTSALTYNVGIDGTITFSGSVKASASSPLSPIAAAGTIPIGLRPSATRYFTLSLFTPATTYASMEYAIVQCGILSDGSIYLYQRPSINITVNQEIDFSQVIYKIN